ncbi:MAG: histidine ammonia-lyase [Candidatus Hodarchaeales archaeon]|jgi:histidine ammonia-lyase
MNKTPVEINGENLSIEDLNAIAVGHHEAKISEKALRKIKMSAQIVQDILRKDKRVYGVTTGFGYLQEVKITIDETKKLQENLIVSHSAGVGPCLPNEVVRGMMVLQINKFARGHSGIRSKIVNYLKDMLNGDITPEVPSKGSLGASGDLAPLAHLSLVLIGKGFAKKGNLRMTGGDALAEINLKPIKLIAKEGLALLNGTQAMTSIAGLSIIQSQYLVRIANITTSLSMEVHRGNIDSLNPLIHEARPHKGQMKTAETILQMVEGSQCVQEISAHQDPYTLRCVPAVHGAITDTIEHSRKIIEVEMNSSTDNPLLFSDEEIFSGGNFHGEPIAFVLDFMSIALAELGNISERRIERLLNPSLSNLPAFLTKNGGLNSGFMIAQYTAAALTSENKLLAVPASVDTISVSADQEDHVSMGMNAANKLSRLITNLTHVLAIELLCVIQAIDLANIRHKLSPFNQEIYDIVRKQISLLEEDRELSPDIEKAVSLIDSKTL